MVVVPRRSPERKAKKVPSQKTMFLRWQKLWLFLLHLLSVFQVVSWPVGLLLVPLLEVVLGEARPDIRTCRRFGSSSPQPRRCEDLEDDGIDRDPGCTPSGSELIELS